MDTYNVLQKIRLFARHCSDAQLVRASLTDPSVPITTYLHNQCPQPPLQLLDDCPKGCKVHFKSLRVHVHHIVRQLQRRADIDMPQITPRSYPSYYRSWPITLLLWHIMNGNNYSWPMHLQVTSPQRIVTHKLNTAGTSYCLTLLHLARSMVRYKANTPNTHFRN